MQRSRKSDAINQGASSEAVDSLMVCLVGESKPRDPEFTLWLGLLLTASSDKKQVTAMESLNFTRIDGKPFGMLTHTHAPQKWVGLGPGAFVVARVLGGGRGNEVLQFVPTHCTY